MRVRGAFALLFVIGLLGCGGGSGPPANPSPPPPMTSAPPPTVPVRPAANTQAAATPNAPQPKAAKVPAKSGPRGDVPPEQDFEVVDDQANFAVLSGPALDQQFEVDDSNPEGDFVSVELPVASEEESTQSLPAGFTAIEEAGVTADGWPRRIRGEVDGKEMACVPEGLFIQGIDSRSPEAAPAHSMLLDTYYMDITEVTIGEYMLFKQDKAGKEGGPSTTVSLDGNPRKPVVKVSWKDAMNYAKWAGKVLPSEAEWEKAGRGPDGYTYPWGNDRVLWHQARQPGQIDPVGSYPHDRSQYGIFDLAGNAREWCSDWYSNTAYQEAKGKDGTPAHNWLGPKKSSHGERVVRGSSQRWELWERGSHSMSKTSSEIGFRCVLRCRAEAPKE